MMFLLLFLISFNLNANCVDNVIDKLNKLTKAKKTIYKVDFTKIYNDHSYTMSPLNFFGIHNHFQGIFLDEHNFYITGGNKSKKSADFFIYHRKNKNLSHYKLNSKKKHWHAGSFQFLGGMFYIPIERLSDPLSSEIIVFNRSDKKSITFLYKDDNKTGAVDFLNINNERYIVLFDPKEISIFNFQTKRLLKKIKTNMFTGSAAKVINDCNQNTYFLNITNNGLLAPLLNNKNLVQIYKLDRKNLKLKELKSLEYSCEYCNFRGAANLIINEKNEISIISSSMYLDRNSKKLYIETFE